MKKILFISACVRKDSRTKRLARRLLSHLEGTAEEVDLASVSFPAADEDYLLQREAQAAKKDADAPLLAHARRFAAADTVVIAAPYWDLSFPSVLKQYLEQVNVVGVTFSYTPEGVPVGSCRAKELYYVTTAGGPILSDEYGFGYVRALAQGFWQIPRVLQVRAEGLDIYGADTEAILRQAEEAVDGMFS